MDVAIVTVIFLAQIALPALAINFADQTIKVKHTG